MNRNEEAINAGCGRYIIGAIAAIIFTPALVGILLSLGLGEIAALPASIAFGAIFAAPFVVTGGLIYAFIERLTPGRWWHAVLIGLLLMTLFLLYIEPHPFSLNSDQIWTLSAMAMVAVTGATIFWYFSRPQKAQGSTTSGRDDQP